MFPVPQRVFFTQGVGRSRDALRSFERALRDAGIEQCNWVHVSSILPPGCRIVPAGEGRQALRPGQIAFCVMARCTSNEPHRLLAASVGCAVPADPSRFGYLSEHHAFGQTAEEAGAYAEDLAAAMLATKLGLPLDDELSWDEKERIWTLSGQIVRTTNVTQSAVARADRYTTVVAAAVFLFD